MSRAKNSGPSSSPVSSGAAPSRPGWVPWLVAAGLVGGVGAGATYWSQRGSEAPVARVDAAASTEGQLDSLAQQAAEVLSAIRSQEAKKDATCWSSVRMIEGFSLGRQLTPAAEIARIEVSRALLKRVWSKASTETQTKRLSASQIRGALPRAVKEAVAALEVAQVRSGSAALGRAEQGMSDQQRTTESRRALLSLILGEVRGDVALTPLETDGAEEVAKTSTALTSLVLTEAARLADEAGLDMVTLENIQGAYRYLLNEWFQGDKSETRSSPGAMSDDAFQVLRGVTMNNARGKLEALAAYNQLKSAPSYSEAGQVAPYLSQLVGFPVTSEAAQALARELLLFARPLLAEGGPLRSDTFSDSLLGYREQKSERRYLELAQAFNAVQDLFPTKRLANADAEVLMVRNVIPAPGQPSQVDERRVSLVAPGLDGVRDTGLHWLVLAQALREDPEVALDPFAAELLSETLSEYAFFLLKGSVKGAVAMGLPQVSERVVQALPWKYPKGRFFPPESPESKTPTPASEAPKVRPLFRERQLPESVSPEQAKKCVADRTGFQGFMGSGVAASDFDGDGRTDLFVAADGCNRLLKNEGNFRFRDVSEDKGISGLGASSRHPVFADVDGDGLLDLLVTQSDAPSRLFLNESGKFVESSENWGLNTRTGAHSATFFDYDRDGDLDLFVGSYGPSEGRRAKPSLDGRNGYANQLFRNEGTRFVDVSQASGLDSTAWTLASAAVDVNADGLPDLWLANDFGRDQVFQNLGDGRFRDVAPELGTDDRGSGMNVSILEFNGDGRPDVFVSMIEMFSKTFRFVLPRGDTRMTVDDRVLASSYYISGMKLFLSSESKSETLGAYRDGGVDALESSRKGWAWGASFFDYDLDGDLDMYLANGWIQKSAFHSQNNQFMVNQGHFLGSYGERAVSGDNGSRPAPGLAVDYAGSSRAVTAVALSDSGREDLIVVDYEGGVRVFENQSASRGQSMRLRLTGAGKNSYGVGATVELQTDAGTTVTRYASAGANYLAQSSESIHLAWPEEEVPNRLFVRWVSGQLTELRGAELASLLESPKAVHHITEP